jgi:hypothetical protein
MRTVFALTLVAILLAGGSTMASHTSGYLDEPARPRATQLDDGVRFTWDAYPYAVETLSLHVSPTPNFHIEFWGTSATVMWISDDWWTTSAFLAYQELPHVRFYAKLAAADGEYVAESREVYVDVADAAQGGFRLYPADVWADEVSLSWDRYTPSDFREYQVHRGTSAFFEPSAATRLARYGDSWTTAAAFPYDDTRDHHYLVRVVRADGSVLDSNRILVVGDADDTGYDGSDFGLGNPNGSHTTTDDEGNLVAVCRGTFDAPRLKRGAWEGTDFIIEWERGSSAIDEILVVLGNQPGFVGDLRPALAVMESPLKASGHATSVRIPFTGEEKDQEIESARREGRTHGYIRLVAVDTGSGWECVESNEIGVRIDGREDTPNFLPVGPALAALGALGLAVHMLRRRD